MANIVRLKRSAVPNKVPQIVDIELGEVAINTYDGKMYFKKDNGAESIVEVGKSNRNWISKSANYTAISGDAILSDTSSGPWSVTLPTSPNIGDIVLIVDAAGTFGTNNLGINRNGELIMGASSNLIISTDNQTTELVYSGATNGWRVM